MLRRLLGMIASVVMAGALGFVGPAAAGPDCGSGAGHIKDEAMCVGRTAESLAGADDDYFREMDYGATKHPDELAKSLAPYVPGITPEQALKAAVVGNSKALIIENRRLVLGRWQGVFLCEFDGPRRREVMVKIVSD